MPIDACLESAHIPLKQERKRYRFPLGVFNSTGSSFASLISDVPGYPVFRRKLYANKPSLKFTRMFVSLVCQIVRV